MHHQAQHLHVFRLAHAVGAVRSLILRRGVPPGIVVDDHVGPCQVKARAACLEGNEEDGFFARVEAVYQLLALLRLCFTVQVEGFDAFLEELAAQ